MKTLVQLLFFLLLFYAFNGNTQTRWIFNDNAFVNIEDKTYLVIGNGNANAISQVGSGGNILSEKETSVIKWNVGSTSGNYNIPFTNTDNVKIPVEISISSPGDVNGNLILSTYRTDNLNSSWPSVSPGVTNMCSSLHPTDASPFVVDRFWRIDANSYNSKPSVNMSLGYDFINEAGGNNTISGESSLRAQRFNPTIGSAGSLSCHGTNVTGNWESLTFGMPNTSTKQVNNIIVGPNDFFKDWILVDKSTPLPVQLISFNALCKEGFTELNWTTGSEKENDFFIIERSVDGDDFQKINTVEGSGNSSSKKNYSYIDDTRRGGIIYYRLVQVDYNGKREYFDIISSNCIPEDNFRIYQEKFSNNSLQFNVYTTKKDVLN